MALLLERIFPIRDAASARLMHVKAHCLLRAGVISRAQKQQVDAAVAAALIEAAQAERNPPMQHAA